MLHMAFEAQSICAPKRNGHVLTSVVHLTANIDRWSNNSVNATWFAGWTGHSDPSKCLCNHWHGFWCLLSAHFCHFGFVDPVPAGHAVPGAQKAQGSLAARPASWHCHGTTQSAVNCLMSSVDSEGMLAQLTGFNSLHSTRTCQAQTQLESGLLCCAVLCYAVLCYAFLQ